jgi:hypothetical protein
MAWSEDLAIYFNADTPSSATVAFSGSAAGMYGIMGAPGELGLSSEQFPGVQQTDRTVLVRTDQKGALVPGSAITVAGTAYTVRYLLPIEDGLITLVYLQ